jgi:ABC-type Fe3+/spermidine/putrescine transport system ATPase subunit
VTDDTFVRLSEVRMEGVGKRHDGAWALKDVSLSIRPGDLYTLLGPARSGKTTLLRLVAGLDVPDEGRIFVDDALIDPVPPAKRNMGMVFQHPALWPHMSVFDNVAFGPRQRGEPADQVARKVKAALERVGAGGIDERRPSGLTGSQPQRVALARALVIQPRLLLLDEPLGGLDAVARARMRLELSELHRDLGTTTIYATRDHAEALALSTRIAILSKGRIVQEGKPEDIYWRPWNRVAAEASGPANLIPVRVIELREIGVLVETAGGARLPVASGGHEWTLGDRGLLCLRPEALRVEESALAPGGITGTVSAQVFEGSRQLYEIGIVGGILRVEMITSALLGRGFKPGDPVKVEVSPETSVLLPDEPAATA